MKHDPEYRVSMRRRFIKEAHKITLEEYTDRLRKQNNECAICKVRLSESGHLTHLDHDHRTGKLRKFLCTNCNRGLGHFKDSAILLEEAKKYLHEHSN